MHPVEEVENYMIHVGKLYVTYNFSVLSAPNNSYDQTILFF